MVERRKDVKHLDRKGTKKKGLLEDKLVAAFDLSAAILYLHNRNIMYRDLKPGMFCHFLVELSSIVNFRSSHMVPLC